MRLLLLAMFACNDATTPGETGTKDGADDPVDIDGDGFTEAQGDCDDVDANVFPGAVETCDGYDQDCDGVADDALMSTWYIDGDGDGYGGTSVHVGCEAGANEVDQGGDCDDDDSDVSPGVVEVCDGRDNDCDGDTDEGVVATWYADADADGYGDPAVPDESCDPRPNYVADNTDCDDASAAVYPGNPESCDQLDNDCNGLVDDGVLVTYYVDLDADGHGDPAVTEGACALPTGYADLGDDCDDADAAVSPSATEVCNAVDDDCDGSIDDDVFPGATELCNGEDDDCDGSLYAGESDDTDADGLYDCEDGDIDGDGLRNAWDADAYDGTVARGPTGGLGGDGAYTASGSETWGDGSWLDGAASAGSDALGVDDGGVFAEGDEVLVLSQQGSDAGTYAFAFVGGVSGDDLSIEPPLPSSFSASSVVLVMRVPHFTDLSVPAGATVSADPWAGGGGGVVVARATGAVSVAGTISTDGLGFRGGDGVAGCCSTYPTSGESYGGVGSYSASANGGGGGTYTNTADGGECGGGGGYGTAGEDGTNSGGTALGNAGGTYGAATMADWFLGSGGGAGSPDTESDGQDSDNLTIDGGAGGGSGGSVLLAAPTVDITGTVAATGGTGASSAWHDGAPYGSAYGGDGGDGRVRVDSDSTSGVTRPSAYAGSFEP